MVTATKEEAAYLREHIKGVCIYKTLRSKGSKRGTYFVEESRVVLDTLESLRNNVSVIYEYPVSE